MEAKCSTDNRVLEERVMNPNIPKNEELWWAKRKIDDLKQEIQKLLGEKEELEKQFTKERNGMAEEYVKHCQEIKTLKQENAELKKEKERVSWQLGQCQKRAAEYCKENAELRKELGK